MSSHLSSHAKIVKSKLALISIAAILVLIGIAYVIMSKALHKEGFEGVACTMEAKQCADGTYVGRQGPKCEFAACPIAPPEGWKTYKGQGVQFSYPENLGTRYITPQAWPPEVVVTKETLTCNETGSQATEGGITKNVTISGVNYCVTVSGEGAAGSTYNAYTYRTQVGENTVAVSFTLRLVQCGNYNEPEKSVCEQERSSFALDSIASRIAQTSKSI